MTNSEKAALDRYLTQGYCPGDASEEYSEEIWGNQIAETEISSGEYENHEEIFWQWEGKLFNEGKTVEEAARIIVRAYNLYLNQPQG